MTQLASQKIHLNSEEEKIRRLLVDVASHCSKNKNDKLVLRFTGGWVRDKILGIASHDVDVGINLMQGFEFATELQSYLKSHGDIYGIDKASIHKVSSNPERSKHLETASTTLYGMELDFVNLRSEEYTAESRVPSKVEFGSPYEDAHRRDATLNALFYNLHTCEVEDWTGLGLEDLSNGILRTPLDPIATFHDDPLRILRLVRFSSRFGFSIADEAVHAMKNPTIREMLHYKISRERIGVEINKIITGPNIDKALKLIQAAGLYESIFCALAHDTLIDTSSLMRALAYCDMLLKVDLPFEIQSNCDYRRLLYLFSILHPYGAQSVSVKDKPVSLAALAVRDGLKFRLLDYETINFGVLRANEIIDFVSTCQKQEMKCSKIGLSLRSWGPYWQLYVVMALLEELCRRPGSYADAILEKYRIFGETIKKLGLLDVVELKPLLNGKQIANLLGIKPGPSIGMYLNCILEWQLDNPQSTPDDCISYIMSIKDPN